jgi:hypothetical protein
MTKLRVLGGVATLLALAGLAWAFFPQLSRAYRDYRRARALDIARRAIAPDEILVDFSVSLNRRAGSVWLDGKVTNYSKDTTLTRFDLKVLVEECDGVEAGQVWMSERRREQLEIESRIRSRHEAAAIDQAWLERVQSVPCHVIGERVETISVGIPPGQSRYLKPHVGVVGAGLFPATGALQPSYRVVETFGVKSSTVADSK